MEGGGIDVLLEKYLTVLDEYTTLRSTLSSLQSDIFHQLARANFSAERGLRYGQDQYDDRMQALRRVHISTSDSGAAAFTVELEESQTSPVEDEQEKGPDVEESTASQDSPAAKVKDPLRWFGILTPMPLRQAQDQAIQAVEQVIPRLASLNAEMAELEIQVRRARKKRTKAEMADKKDRHLEGVAMKEETAA